MGVIFHWFKEYSIKEDYYCASIEYAGDCGSTTHSYGNRSKLYNLFEKVNCRIPIISNKIFDDDPEKYVQNLLVNPVEMSKKCQELLDSDLYLNVIEDNRIRWIKELSDEGYYVAYDKS